MTSIEREGTFVAWEEGLLGAVLVNLAPDDQSLAPWTESCEGCDGSGHQHWQLGPCGDCFGTGGALLAFEVGGRWPLSAMWVPPQISAWFVWFNQTATQMRDGR